MQLTPTSFDGNTFPSTDYDIYFPEGTVMSAPDSQIAQVERTFEFPTFTRRLLKGRNFVVQIVPRGTIHSQIDSLKTIFSTREQSMRSLVATDSATTDVWTVDCAPVSAVYSPNTFTVTLSAPDPLWKHNVESSDSWAITAGSDTNILTVGGNEYTRPEIRITPTGAKTEGFTKRQFVIIRNVTDSWQRQYGLDITGGGLDTAALAASSDLQADGDDLRVYVDGREVPRWFSTTDPSGSSACEIWVNLNLPPAASVTLDTAIGSGDNPTEITVQPTATNGNYLQAIANRKPQGLAQINAELFEYTGVNVDTWKFTGVSRAARSTTAADHSSADTIYMIPHDIWIYYGNPSMTPPAYSDDTKPAFDLAASSNSSWSYTSFGTRARRNSGIWQEAEVKATGPNTRFYTAPDNTRASPWTEMGATVQAWQNNGNWTGSTGFITWTLSHPAGITSVISSGRKQNISSNTWYSTCGLQRSSDNGESWVTVFTLSAPSSTSWEAWSSTDALGATYNDIRFAHIGSCSATANAHIDNEVQAVTATIDTNNVPSITVLAQDDAYELNCVITNTTTSEAITLNYVMALNKTLVVDCENKTVTYRNTNAAEALTYPARFEWMTLDPGSNNITFDDTGTTGVTIVTRWYARHS